MIHIIIRYKGKELEFSAETPEDVISEILRWFRLRFDKEDWPYILKWVEGIKE